MIMIIHNYYFLVAGVVALLFAIGHSVWGLKYVLNYVQASGIPNQTKHMLFVIWNQPTVFHFFSSLTLVALSTIPNKAVTNPLAIFIGLVSFGFFLNYVGSSMIRNPAALAPILPQAVALMMYLGILGAGVIRNGS